MSDDTTTAAIATGPEIDIDLRCPLWRDALPDVEALCRAAAASALTAARIPPESVEISLVLADDDLLQELNRSWRGRDEATNVLAFPCDGAAPGAPRRMLGDVVIAWRTTMREAAADGIPPRDHLAHLVVHGVLHLLGYDHVADEDAALMERCEAAALAPMGVADPYDGLAGGERSQ